METKTKEKSDDVINIPDECRKNLDEGVDYKVYKNCMRLLDKDTGFLKANALRPLDPTSFFSNRFNYWKNVFSLSERPIAGYGTLGDRFLIGQNSHNTLVYSYASGGIVSLILIMVIMIRYSYLCILIVFFKKIKLTRQNLFLFSSIFTIAFLIFRGVAEVGIGVFSIDFLVFLTCISICEKFIKENRN